MTLTIASRTSPLALWQTNRVVDELKSKGILSHILPVESTGDKSLLEPIYALGVNGVFTKELDIALLEKRAHLAVHSLKDVPTQLAKGLKLVAVLNRGSYKDILLYKKKIESKYTVATSSLRRRAQWLEKYPEHQIVPIRGNVQTRLKKFAENPEIDAVIFAKAGLERLELIPQNSQELDWMLPAPAQGTIGIICHENDLEIIRLCNHINHRPSFQLAFIERQFMNILQGGCSVPISALAYFENYQINVKCAIHSYDGQESYSIQHLFKLDDWQKAGKELAEKFLNNIKVKNLLEILKLQKPI